MRDNYLKGGANQEVEARAKLVSALRMISGWRPEQIIKLSMGMTLPVGFGDDWCGTPFELAFHTAGKLTGLTREELKRLSSDPERYSVIPEA